MKILSRSFYAEILALQGFPAGLRASYFIRDKSGYPEFRNNQAFSSVGLQHGFEDKTKGTIFFDIAKIIKMTRPKVVFLENVQNLLSHDKQATFKTIVDTLDRQLDYHIVGVTHDKDGIPQYKRSAFLRNSRDFGVPQNRPRVYIVAFSRAYFGQHISLLPEEAPTKRSRTPVFKSLADVLDKKVDSRFFSFIRIP